MGLLPIPISSILQPPVLIAWLADNDIPYALREMTSAFDAWRFAEINEALYTLSVVVLVTLVLVTVVLFTVSVVIVVVFLMAVVIIVLFLLTSVWKMMCSTMSTDEQSKRRALITCNSSPPNYTLTNQMVG